MKIMKDVQQLDPYSPEGCFIATAAYGTETHPRIDVLRDFRDSYLKRFYFGRLFTRAYYRLSPPVADYIARSESRMEKVRKFFVEPCCRVVERVSTE